MLCEHQFHFMPLLDFDMQDFFYIIIIFVVLASLVPKRSIMRYLRYHLGFSGFGILVLLAFFLKGLAFFGILASFFASWHFEHFL